MVYNPVYANPEEGLELHQEQCIRCHSSDAYTRANHSVKTLPQLGTQVRMCKNTLGITWFEEEVDSVTEYINKSFYKF